MDMVNAPTAGAVRRYLREFLSDPRVIEAYLGRRHKRPEDEVAGAHA